MKKAFFWVLYIVVIYVLLDFFVLKAILPSQHLYEIPDQKQVPYLGYIGDPESIMFNEEGFTPPTMLELQDSAGIKIAFFGGSTGFLGNPPIPFRLQELLRKRLDTTVYVANYSFISLNHRQHLHILVEYLLQSKLDLVIFYGGFNETLGTAFHDPRPGYPHNYYFKVETPAWKQWLIKHSALSNTLEQRFNAISRFGELRDTIKIYDPKWSEDIVVNYLDCIRSAESLSHTIQTQPPVFTKPFVGIFQPFLPTDEIRPVYNAIRDSIADLSYTVDLSAAFKSTGDSVYTDMVHVHQYGREIIADRIAGIVMELHVHSENTLPN